jgi:sugar lactone lactonase YvrE
MGGMNTVDVSDGNAIVNLTTGEPEPTDIAAGPGGDVYWTCKSAGVILTRSAEGVVSLLLDNLMSPAGIALDHQGRKLYFTEVPTPGMPGGMGGQNAVWVYDLATGALDPVDMGDPEPTDIAVARNGRVYWTCTSAGVIVEAIANNE